MKRPRTVLEAVLMAAGLIWLGGCITLGKAADATFLPDYDLLPPTVVVQTGPVIRLVGVDAAFGLDRKYMVYREAEGDVEVKERRDLQWLVSPTDLVARKFIEHALVSDAIGFAFPPTTATTGVDIDYEVRLTVRRFDEVHGPDGWAAVFAVDVIVLRPHDRENKVVGLAHLPAVRQPAAVTEPRAVAEAMAAAVRQGLDGAVAAVAGMIARGGGPGR